MGKLLRAWSKGLNHIAIYILVTAKTLKRHAFECPFPLLLRLLGNQGHYLLDFVFYEDEGPLDLVLVCLLTQCLIHHLHLLHHLLTLSLKDLIKYPFIQCLFD